MSAGDHDYSSKSGAVQHLPMFQKTSLGVASAVVAVSVSMTGAWEAADAAVVRVATETGLHDHSTVLELVSARRRTYEYRTTTTNTIVTIIIHSTVCQCVRYNKNAKPAERTALETRDGFQEK